MLSTLATSSLLFFSAFLAGAMPYALGATHTQASCLRALNDIARGLFLGEAFIHLLPEAMEAALIPALVFCTATIGLLYLIEQSLKRALIHRFKHGSYVAYLLFIALSLHSIFAGAALGIEHPNIFYQVLTAILSHKIAAAFALAITLKAHKIPIELALPALAFFALMTPLGIQLASLPPTSWLVPLQAAAAGTFIYVAGCQQLDNQACEHVRIQPMNGVRITVGFLAIALLHGMLQ